MPLWRRIIDRIKEGEVGLAIIRRLKRHITLRNFKIIKKLPVKCLSLSEMFIKVLYSRPTNIDCVRLLEITQIDYRYNLSGCCPDFLPAFGNLLNADLLETFNSYRARIIKLSALNHSYCLCNLNLCQDASYTSTPIYTLPDLKSPLIPKYISLGFDTSCNLHCTMCRKDFYNADNVTKKTLNEIATKIVNSKWIREAPYVILAGNGELFYSDVYRRLLENLNRKQIEIFSNGTLFNKAQWEKIKTKYEEVEVTISVDAATVATYKKIRGGDFKQLMQHLEMLGDLRKNNEIKRFTLNFVVQKDNYKEMIDFIGLAKRIHSDKIKFLHLNNYGVFTKKEYWQKSLLCKNGCLQYQLYLYLCNSIFQDQIVDLSAFKPYLFASAKRYGKRNEKSGCKVTDDKKQK